MIINPVEYSRELSGSDAVRKWWRAKVKSTPTPFFASAVTELSPRTVEAGRFGIHFSAVFQRGTRVYCFTTQSDRDRFLTFHRKGYSAKPCGNPHK